jgi:hypothetical protein
MSKYTSQVEKLYKRSETKAAIGLDSRSKGGPKGMGYTARNGSDFVLCSLGRSDALTTRKD